MSSKGFYYINHLEPPIVISKPQPHVMITKQRPHVIPVLAKHQPQRRVVAMVPQQTVVLQQQQQQFLPAQPAIVQNIPNAMYQQPGQPTTHYAIPMDSIVSPNGPPTMAIPLSANNMQQPVATMGTPQQVAVTANMQLQPPLQMAGNVPLQLQIPATQSPQQFTGTATAQLVNTPFTYLPPTQPTMTTFVPQNPHMRTSLKSTLNSQQQQQLQGGAVQFQPGKVNVLIHALERAASFH